MLGPTSSIQARHVKRRMVVLLQSRPCKILNISTIKSGKHGQTKLNFSGIDVFTGKKYHEIYPITHLMKEAILNKNKVDLLNIDKDGYLVLKKDGNTREYRSLPDNDFKEIQTLFNKNVKISVTVLSWGTEEMVISYERRLPIQHKICEYMISSCICK